MKSATISLESLVMRKQQLPLNQTQKVRFERAMELLSSLSSTEQVIVSESIPVNHEDAFLKGHGTSEVDGKLLATVCGTVHRVDKLVYVRTLRSRYKPEAGDIVVCRVIEVAQSHWRVELNSSHNGVLNFPSMNMGNIFVQDDVLCAQVGSFQLDGSLKLLAPSPKYYRKLEKGQLLKVDPYLVKRSKPQFHYIESLGIDLILGCNGFIWVGEHGDPMIVDDEITSKEQSHTPLETRQSICRTGNAIRVLSNLGFTMTVKLIMETFNLSNTENINMHDMLGSEFHVVVAEKEAERRHA